MLTAEAQITVKYIKCRRFVIETFGLRKGDMEHTELSGGQKPAYILYTMLCPVLLISEL